MQTSARRADPDFALSSTGPASVLLAGPYFVARVAAALAGALGVLTLVLAMIGLYGVLAHLVAQRTREVGVRMAIGATRGHIQRMIVREGVVPVLQGVVAGVVLAVGARLALRTFISGDIHAVDPVAFALVPLPFVAAAWLACAIPARRASRVDPNVALRQL